MKHTQLFKLIEEHSAQRHKPTLHMLVACCMEYYSCYDKDMAEIPLDARYPTAMVKNHVAADNMLPAGEFRVQFSWLLNAVAFEAQKNAKPKKPEKPAAFALKPKGKHRGGAENIENFISGVM